MIDSVCRLPLYVIMSYIELEKQKHSLLEKQILLELFGGRSMTASSLHVRGISSLIMIKEVACSPPNQLDWIKVNFDGFSKLRW